MNFKQKCIYIYFIILPIIDLITSLHTRFIDFPVSLGMVIKGLTVIGSIIYIFLFSKSKYKSLSIRYIFIIIGFALFYFLCKCDSWSIGNFIEEFMYAFRYLYFPFMLVGAANIFDDCDIDNQFIKKILFINCIMYTLLLLIPYITGTSFDSYRYNGVLGKNGWFYAANETGAIMIVLLSSILYFLDTKNKWKLFIAFPIMLSISLIGTKVSYFGLMIAIIIISIVFIIKNKKKGILSVFILFVLLFFACNFSPTTENLQGSINNAMKPPEVVDKEDIKQYKYETVLDLIQNKTIARIVTVALNGRADFFLKNYSVYEESGIKNILFGLGWHDREEINYVIEKKLIEIDYLDIIIHYGIIGFFVYFLPIFYFIYKLIKKRSLLKIESFYYLGFVLIIFAISCLAGHVLSSPTVSIYLILLILLIDNSIKETFDINKNEITIMALHLNYGGIEKYISSLCEMLKDDFKINIIVTYKLLEKPAFKFDNRINISYLICDKPNKQDLKDAINRKMPITIMKELLKAIKILYLKRYRNKVAIKKINSKYIITTREFHNTLVGKYANEKIIKIATEHNYHNNNNKYINKVIKSLRNIDYFIVVSKSLEAFYKDKIKNTKCVYIPNVIDELPMTSSSLNKNNLINIGRLEQEKAQNDLIDIVQIVKKKVPDLKLYIIGDGSLKSELEHKVKEAGLDKTILFTGFLSKTELEKYLIEAKAFVMTSYTESFGLVLLEAMSYRVPCIAFDSARGAEELLSDDVGILIPNRDKTLMAERIVNLLKNDKYTKKYSKSGYKKCQEYLSCNVKKAWLNILK